MAVRGLKITHLPKSINSEMLIKHSRILQGGV